MSSMAAAYDLFQVVVKLDKVKVFSDIHLLATIEQYMYEVKNWPNTGLNGIVGCNVVGWVGCVANGPTGWPSCWLMRL